MSAHKYLSIYFAPKKVSVTLYGTGEKSSKPEPLIRDQSQAILSETKVLEFTRFEKFLLFPKALRAKSDRERQEEKD